MNLDQLVPELQKLADFEAVRSRLLADAGHPAALSVADAAKPYVLAALHAALDRPLLLITARPSQARFLRDEIACWHPHPSGVLLFPEQDVLPFEPLPADQQTTAERLAVLTRLLEDRQGGRSSPPPSHPRPFVIACARAAADLLAAPADFERASSRLRVGERARPETLIERWLELGYEPAPVVDSPGQFGRRGGILDVYPLVGEPCRIEFFGDEVESLRTFDPLTQRSATKVDEVLITPSAERRAGASACLLDYLPPDGVLALDERRAIANVAREFDRQVAGLRDDLVARGELDSDATAPYLEWQNLAQRLERLAGPRLELEHDPEAETFPFVHPPAFGGRLRHFLDECRRLVAAGQRVVVVTQQAQRIGELLEETGDQRPETRDPGPETEHGQG